MRSKFRMSLEKAMADMLRFDWRRADELTGTVVASLDNLQEKLPKDRYNGDCYENTDSFMEDVKVYSANKKILNKQEHVAYECKDGCKGIVIGPPEIESYNTIRVLSGRQGVKYSCTKCNSTLYEHTFGWS